ncbi:MAG TPA: hypothetical protein VI072_31260 [Polyangiaceae bacterium]
MTARSIMATACSALALAWASVAGASDIFPEELRAHLELPAAPACTLCHDSDEGGTDTVVTPFGVTLLRFGATALNAGSLRAALDAAEQQAPDSDFDTVSDIEELRQGTDPNDGVALPVPLTGCSVSSRIASRMGWLSYLILAPLLVRPGRRRGGIR